VWAVNEWASDELEDVGVCPICLAPDNTLFASGLSDLTASKTPGSWSLCRCSSCATLFLTPRPTAASIHRAYESPSYYTHNPITTEPARSRLRRLRIRLRNGYLNVRHDYDASPASGAGALLFRAVPPLAIRSDFWIRHLRHPGGSPRLLDVGCGHGHLVAHMRELGWQVEGVDVDPRAVALAREAGVDARVGTLVGLKDELDPGYDAITFSHSIEHLHDPRGTLMAACKLLRSRGVLWIATPNATSVGLRLFGSRWRGLEPPRHLVVASNRGLRDMLKAVGFEDVRSPVCSPRARWYFEASWAIADRSNSAESSRVAMRSLSVPLVTIAALISNALTVVRPDLGEESVLMARKP
jgi:SAM-dependent methyltransferase